MLLSLEGRRLYYDLVGSASGPVVCLTHSLSSDSGMWADQLPVLASAGFRVLRLDMRGHGGSEKLAGDYTMSALAGDVAAVLERLGLAGVHYIGLSIGGMIGQALAIEHCGTLKSMLLCDTMAATMPDGRENYAPRLAAVTEASSLEPIADATMERWFTGAFKRRRPSRWREVRDTVAATTPDGYRGCVAAILDFDFVARLPSVDLPTLVLCGADDARTPPAENKRIAALIPGARYAEIADARHAPNIEHPEIFNKIMLDWLVARTGHQAGLSHS
jgi:3-oxoadipate enol-lactonase